MGKNDTTLSLEWLSYLGDENLQHKALSADAIVVYSPGLERVIWANASGASLFGGGSVADFMASDLHSDHPFIHQLKAAVHQLDEERIYRGFRVVNDGQSRFLQCEIGFVELHSDAHDDKGCLAIMVSCTNAAMENLSEPDFAQLVLENLGNVNPASAICDPHGLVISATDKFVETAVPTKVMEETCSGLGDAHNASLSVVNEQGDNILVKLFRVGTNPQRILMLLENGSIGAEEEVSPALEEELSENLTQQPINIGAPIVGVPLIAGNYQPPENEVEDIRSSVNDEVLETDPDLQQSERKGVKNKKPKKKSKLKSEKYARKQAKKQAKKLRKKLDKKRAKKLDKKDGKKTGKKLVGDFNDKSGNGFDAGIATAVASSAIIKKKRRDKPADLPPSSLDKSLDELSDKNAQDTSNRLEDVPISLRMHQIDREGENFEKSPLSNPEETKSGFKPDGQEDDFVFSGDSKPIRFAWITNTEQEFTSVSAELAKAVGPNAADIVGRKWQDVATVFGFDKNGEIQSLLKKQDTWSGKSVLWPVQGTDLQVPIDLAALPSFSSGRNFDGFRGFGIVRMFDTIVDPEEAGMALISGGIHKVGLQETSTNGANEAQQPAQQLTQQLKKRSAGENPLEEISASQGSKIRDKDKSNKSDKPNNIVKLNVRRGAGGEDVHLKKDEEDTRLTNGENRAFSDIGKQLRDSSKYGISHLHRDHDKNERPSHKNISSNDLSGDQRTSEELSKNSRTQVDTTLLARLPVPVLVYRGDETLFANGELLSLTGYASFQELKKAGGMSALFDHDNSGDISEVNETVLIDKDGGKMRVKALLQSVPWDNESALLLSFRQPRHEKLAANEKIVLDMMRVSELHNVLDTAADGIIILDKIGTVQSINKPAEALFGRLDEDVREKPITDIFAAESHERISEYLSSLDNLESKTLLHSGCEVIGIEAKGGLIPLYLTIGNIGSTDKYCAILRDMTSWKKTREELVEARKQAENASDQKTEFLARVSHEIRTPLNAIIGFSDVMIEERFGAIDNDRYREYLRDINRSGIHVLDLINDLLDISKIEAGKMELSFEAVDLNRIVGETVALLQPQANGNRVLIRTSLSRAVPKVVADARSIRQIVINLVSNAIKFTDANGQVIVSTVYEGNGEVALRVRDTGRGMSNEEVAIALKPFRQVNTISETRGQGTGLGLPLTKALVEANKAYLDIDSEPGEGTIVHIQFPTQRVLAD